MKFTGKLAIGLSMFALVAMGADDCATETKTDADKASSAEQREDSSADESATPDPSGAYDLDCSYELGDFGDSGDPAKGYRFVAGGTIENTGNIGARVRVTYKWKLLGRSAHTVRKTYRLRVGQERDVNITVPVTQDDISAHQNADGDCSTKATIIGSFGNVSG